MDIDVIRRQIKANRGNHLTTDVPPRQKHSKLTSFLVRLMILAVLFLGTLIYAKSSTANKQWLYNTVFKDNISFAVINNMYNKYLGGILPFKNVVSDNEPVFKEKLTYSGSSVYKDGVALNVDKSYMVPSLNSGIVVFTGEKDGYGKTIIIQQVNGVDVWYGNIDNLNIKLYDYVEGGTLLGETISDKLYLVFKKEGKVVDYKEYLQ